MSALLCLRGLGCDWICTAAFVVTLLWHVDLVPLPTAAAVFEATHAEAPPNFGNLTTFPSTKSERQMLPTVVNYEMVMLAGQYSRGVSDDDNIVNVRTPQQLGGMRITAARFPARRRLFGSALHAKSNTVFIVGGLDDGNLRTNTFWAYNVTGAQWNTALPPLPCRVSGNAVVEMNDKIYSFGGESDSPADWRCGRFTSVFDLQQQQTATGTDNDKPAWRVLPYSLPGSDPTSSGATNAACAVTLKNSIYLLGVNTDDEFGWQAFRSDDGALTWTQLRRSRYKFTSCVAVPVSDNDDGRSWKSDKIFVVGEWSPAYDLASAAEIYDVATNTWRLAMNTGRLAQSMTHRRDYLSAIRLPTFALSAGQDKKILVCGRTDSSTRTAFKPHATSKPCYDTETCEIYDLMSDSWSPIETFEFGLPFDWRHFAMINVDAKRLVA